MWKAIGSVSGSLLSLVLLVFALSAIYNTGVGAYHYDEIIHPVPTYTNYGFWCALMKVMCENLVVTIIAFLIVALWAWWEWRSIKRNDEEKKIQHEREDYRDALLRELVRHQGVDTSELDKKYSTSTSKLP
jgi:hypothetical protein